MRYDIAYTEQDKIDFLSDLDSILCDMLEASKGKLHMRKKGSSCEMPYRCKYLDACASKNMSGFVQGTKLFTELNSV